MTPDDLTPERRADKVSRVFSIGRLVVMVSWALDGRWWTTDKLGVRHEYFVSFGRETAPQRHTNLQAWVITFGPACLRFGVARAALAATKGGEDG